MAARTRDDWLALGAGTLTDGEVAAAAGGISRQAVYQARKRFDIPANLEHARARLSLNGQATVAKRLGERDDRIVGWYQQLGSVYRVAKKLKLSYESVKAALERSGLTFDPKPVPIDWSSVDWHSRTSDLARSLGVTQAYVSRRRTIALRTGAAGAARAAVRAEKAAAARPEATKPAPRAAKSTKPTTKTLKVLR